MKTVGDRLDSTRKAYDDMVGTRTRQLDRQVKAIDRENKADRIKPLIADDDSLPELEDKTGEDEEGLLL
jgi:DNA anti-recombination protein RmuC